MVKRSVAEGHVGGVSGVCVCEADNQSGRSLSWYTEVHHQVGEHYTLSRPGVWRGLMCGRLTYSLPSSNISHHEQGYPEVSRNQRMYILTHKRAHIPTYTPTDEEAYMNRLSNKQTNRQKDERADIQIN